MRLRHTLTDFAAWDQIARRIIQDPYSLDRGRDWEQLNQWMLRILRGYLRSRVRADFPLEDVQQQATEALIGALETYNPVKDDKPTQHILAQVRYRMGEVGKKLRNQVPTIPVDPRAPALMQSDTASASMEDQVIDRLTIQEAIAQLKPAERTVIQCTFFHDWPDEQIRQTFGWNANRVYQYRFQGLKTLGELLGEDYRPRGLARRLARAVGDHQL